MSPSASSPQKVAPDPSLAAARERELNRLEHLGRTLDARYRVPGTSFRVGLDGLVGLIPGIGDTLVAIPSVYMIARGWRLGARKRTVARMAVNAGVDYTIGLVPILGDLADLGFKGNLRNVALLRREFGGAAAEGTK